ncbi:MAG: FAD:protein FMN transferase [Epulopiscium sp.]|nr:FAD:protein FMN transferase [Candidatus Epulonipiscium sp.]
MNKKLVAIIFLVLISILSGCHKNKGLPSKPISNQTFALGTVIDIQVYDKDDQKARQAIEESINRVAEIEKKMTVNKKISEVISINKNAGEKSVVVSPDTFFVISEAKKYSELSQGAFDLTIEPIVKLWGIGTNHAKIPKKEEINSLLSLVNYKDVKLNKTTYNVGLSKKGQAIDLGAIAKGYAGDEIKRVLEEQGIHTAFINLGGNVVTIGTKLDGGHWKIGIQNPLDERGKHIAVVEVKDETVVTSGNYERYFIEDGKRYHHIINPKNGYPAEAGIISSTIVTKSSIDADALSTSVYVLGLEKGMKLIKDLDDVECVIITEDNKVYITSGLKERFRIVDPQFTLVD